MIYQRHYHWSDLIICQYQSEACNYQSQIEGEDPQPNYQKGNHTATIL